MLAMYCNSESIALENFGLRERFSAETARSASTELTPQNGSFGQIYAFKPF